MSAEPTAEPEPMVRPCYLGATGPYLFAWHHAAVADLRRRAAVVLCPPLGFDYVCVYRTWRILAQALAALGFDVLRFDYHGTGDSEGEPDEPRRLEAWLVSIERATARAQEITGTDHVALVGLRLGATLAVEAAAARGGVSRLVLWSPFRSGRAYVREVQAFARLSPDADEPVENGEGDIQAAGHIVTAETVNALKTLDLDTVTTRPAEEVLIVERDDRPGDRQIGARLEALGARVTQGRPPGTMAMLVQPALSEVPGPVLDAITSWLAAWRPPGALPAARGESLRETSSLGFAADYRERAVQFGPGDRLFGILTEPAVHNPDAPAIVLFTTGSEPRIGPNRLYVPLARAWAAAGHVVLRYDLGGVGDSRPPCGTADNIAYPGHALDDAREALALVRIESPATRRVVAIGLCSGGWLSFRAALDGLAVDAIVAINPPLYLRDGAAGMRWATDDSEFERYRGLLFDRTRWSKVMRGRAAYATFLRLSLGSLGRKLLARLNTTVGGRLNDGFRRELDAISARGIASLFVFSQGDRGLDYFRLYGGAARRGQRSRRGIHHVVVDGAGHTFRPLPAQRALRRLLLDFVAGQVSRPRPAGGIGTVSVEAGGGRDTVA